MNVRYSSARKGVSLPITPHLVNYIMNLNVWREREEKKQIVFEKVFVDYEPLGGGCNDEDNDDNDNNNNNESKCCSCRCCSACWSHIFCMYCRGWFGDCCCCCYYENNQDTDVDVVEFDFRANSMRLTDLQMAHRDSPIVDITLLKSDRNKEVPYIVYGGICFSSKKKTTGK